MAQRIKLLKKLISEQFPLISYYDSANILAKAKQRHLDDIGAKDAIWLAAIAYIRHEYSDYDSLRDEGYDRDSAYYLILEDINAVLAKWGALKRLDSLPHRDETE